ncbi:MAG: hypothetical protein KKE20_05155, partial [Nanoarchaeota archaeon]|nr:hypothetical protein [Nanoarchaeota archaeon]
KKILSAPQYHKLIEKYDKRLEVIRRTREKLRSKRVGLMKTEQEIEALKRERKSVIELIKKTQKEYLEKGMLTRGKFFDIYKSDRRRLLELEKERIALEQKLEREKHTNKYRITRAISIIYSEIKNLFRRNKRPPRTGGLFKHKLFKRKRAETVLEPFGEAKKGSLKVLMPVKKSVVEELKDAYKEVKK